MNKRIHMKFKRLFSTGNSLFFTSKKFWLSFTLLSAGLLCFGKTTVNANPPVQWASYLVFQNNNYGFGAWSGKQATGHPNAIPPGKLSPDAFRLNEESGFGKIIFGYYQATEISQILVVENHLPGRIAKISVFDVHDQEYLIREFHTTPPDIPHRLLSIRFEKTAFKVKKVAITMNTRKFPGWSQIDAVGICEQYVDRHTLQVIEGTAHYYIGEYFSLVQPVYRNAQEAISTTTELMQLYRKGNPIYFIREYLPDDLNPVQPTAEFHPTNWLNGRWSRVQGHQSLHSGTTELESTVSADGITLWTINNYIENGAPQAGLAVSFNAGTSWTSPRQFTIEGFRNPTGFRDFYMSNNGQIIIMAMGNEDAVGGQDLYVSHHEGSNEWSAPINLGPVINTEQTEYGPYLMGDNKTLAFSSNGHKPGNDADIYFSKRLDDTWTTWSKPVNPGPLINSAAWDGYLSSQPMASTIRNDSDGPSQTASKEKKFSQVLVCLEPLLTNTVILKGVVIDKETRDSLDVDVYCHTLRFGKENITETEVTEPESGSFLFSIDDRQRYMVDIEREGYVPYSKIVSLPDSTFLGEEVSMIAALTPLKIDQVFEIEDLLFVQSKADILPESLPSLQKVLKLLLDFPGMVIEIGGHTDNIGGQQANLELSQKRAESVMGYLISQGIDDERIEAVGYGGSKPVAPNYDPEKRKLNRRVEIKILDY
jgi:outer membrane protein OmpA-like peptidoglycan-associated protein